jgi:hypothetical protein
MVIDYNMADLLSSLVAGEPMLLA